MVGTIIKQTLARYRIKPTAGCRCYKLAEQMDQAGPDEVEANLDYWVRAMEDSIRQWKKLKGRAWSLLPNPPQGVVRDLIEYAIAEARQLEGRLPGKTVPAE